MARLTPAQKYFIDYICKRSSVPYFRRDKKKDKEQCFVGRKKIDPRVFFFFYDIGYLKLDSHIEGRKYDYYYMGIMSYKLDEYLEDFQMPYVIPE